VDALLQQPNSTDNYTNSTNSDIHAYSGNIVMKKPCGLLLT